MILYSIKTHMIIIFSTHQIYSTHLLIIFSVHSQIYFAFCLLAVDLSPWYPGREEADYMFHRRATALDENKNTKRKVT